MREQWLKWFVVILSGVAVTMAALFATLRTGPGDAPSESPSSPVSEGTDESDDEGRPNAGQDVSRDKKAEAEPGKASGIFIHRCGDCHTRSDVIEALVQKPKSRRHVWTADFLARHHPPPDSEREALVEYLVRLAREEVE